MTNKTECLEGSPETDEDHSIVIHGKPDILYVRDKEDKSICLAKDGAE